MYAVFFIRDGKWTMHMTFLSMNDARTEASYLAQSIGVTADVFKEERA